MWGSLLYCYWFCSYALPLALLCLGVNDGSICGWWISGRCPDWAQRVYVHFRQVLPLPADEECTIAESTITIEVNYILACGFDKIDQQMNWKRNNKMKDSITHGVKGKSMKFHLQAK